MEKVSFVDWSPKDELWGLLNLGYCRAFFGFELILVISVKAFGAAFNGLIRNLPFALTLQIQVGKVIPNY